MPRYAQSNIPSAITPLIAGIGANRVRLAVVLDLAAHPGSTRAEIAQRTGARPQNLYVHLNALEDAGLIVADISAPRRHGTTPRWRLNGTALYDATTALRSEL